MRQVREEVMVKTYAIKKKNKMWSRRATVLPTLRFSREFGLVFCGVAGFLKACGLLLFRLVSIDICLFLGLFFCRFMFCGLFFFQYLWHFYCFNVLLKHIGCVFMKICSFWACFFGFTSLTFYLIFLLIFRFVGFSCQRMLGLFFGWITYF